MKSCTWRWCAWQVSIRLQRASIYQWRSTRRCVTLTKQSLIAKRRSSHTTSAVKKTHQRGAKLAQRCIYEQPFFFLPEAHCKMHVGLYETLKPVRHWFTSLHVCLLPVLVGKSNKNVLSCDTMKFWAFNTILKLFAVAIMCLYFESWLVSSLLSCTSLSGTAVRLYCILEVVRGCRVIASFAVVRVVCNHWLLFSLLQVELVLIKFKLSVVEGNVSSGDTTSAQSIATSITDARFPLPLCDYSHKFM